MDAFPSPYCWLTPIYGCLALPTSVLYPSNLSNAMWYQSSKSILCFQSNKRYWSRIPFTAFVKSPSLITRKWNTCFLMSVMSLLLFQDIYVQLLLHQNIVAHLSLPWSIGWVALSFLVVVVPLWWHLTKSPLLLPLDPQTHTFSESLW